MKKLLTAILMIFSYVAVSGEEIYFLTLDRSIEIAKQQSYRMQNLKYTLDIATQSYKVAIGRLRTKVTFDATLPLYDESVSQNTTPIKDDQGNIIGNEIYFASSKSLYMSGNLQITQPLPTNGQIYLRTRYNLTNDYNFKDRNGILDVKLGLSQPIDALYGYNALKADLTRAKLDYEQATKSYKRNELDLVYSVSSSYYNLLASQKRTEIAKLNLQRQQEAYEMATQKYEAGLIREVDALQMEVDLAEVQSSYDEAVLNELENTSAFKDLLQLNESDSVVLQNDLSYEVVHIDEALAVKLALENRLEIREQEITIEQNRLDLKQQKAAGMPQASLVAEFGKMGTNKSPFTYSYGNSLSDMFSNFSDRPMSYNIGLTISVPIIDWGQNKARVKISETRLEQSLLSQEQNKRDIAREVSNLIASININLKRLQILEKSLMVAEKSFEITLQRFYDGDIDSQTMTLDRERLNNAYLSHLSAFTSYQLSLADLMRQTFYDFTTGRPIE